MLKNYISVMFRSLLKRKVFTFINLSGLAIGFAVSILLLLYIQYELGYDSFHQRNEQIYRLALERKYPNRTALMGEIPIPIGPAVKNEFPEVEESVSILNFAGNGAKIRVDDKSFEDKEILAVDSTFFQVFSGDFIEGDINTALHKPGTAVLNESTARRIFGSPQNALGKSLIINGFLTVTVDGVCRDWPEKSHIKFNILFSSLGLNTGVQNYYDLITYTYLLLNKNASAELLESKLPLIVEKYVSGEIQQGFGISYEQFIKEGNGYRYFLQPLTKIHLYSQLEDELNPVGSIQRVYIFGGIAAFILFLACINFINLSTAVSVDRAREVGIRKAFGSRKNTLVWQFVSESIIFCLASFVVAILLVVIFAPILSDISGTNISIHNLSDPWDIVLTIAFVFIIGAVAGLYPAFVLSSFKPISILKGNFKSTSKGLALRNGLVIFQFSISIILIIFTIAVNVQMKFMLGDRLGFQRDHIIVLDGLNGQISNGEQIPKNRLVEEVSKIAGVDDWSRCSDLPDGRGFASLAMQAVDTKTSRTQKTIFVDERYTRLLGMKLKEGRFFSTDFASDSMSLLLNEQAVKDFGLKNPIGAKITSTESFFNSRDGKTIYTYTVVGVVKDFHFESLHRKITPLVMANTGRFGWGMVALKIKGDHFKSTLNYLEKVWQQIDPKSKPKYYFLDQSVASLYQAEKSEQKIFTLFSFLAIFIASIGLFGLSTYAIHQRIKEVSIRKILGAAPTNIILVLSKDFMILIGISMLIAFPVAWWVLDKWLHQFAYRITPGWGIFMLGGTIALIIAALTIGFQAVKTAKDDPLKSLMQT